MAEKPSDEAQAPPQQDHRAYATLAVTLMKQANLEAAEAAWRSAIAAAPENAAYYLQLSRLLLRLKQPEAALEASRSAVRLDPGKVDYRAQFAVALERAGCRDQEVEAALREAISVAPENARIHGHLGNVLMRLKRPREAMDALRQAIALAPTDASFHFALVAPLDRIGDQSGALQAAARATELKPDSVQYHRRHALLLAKAGDLEAALAAAYRMVVADPRDASCHLFVVEMARKLYRFDEADAAVKKAAALAPGRGDVYNAKWEAKYRDKPARHMQSHLTESRASAFKAAVARMWAREAPVTLSPPPAAEANTSEAKSSRGVIGRWFARALGWRTNSRNGR